MGQFWENMLTGGYPTLAESIVWVAVAVLITCVVSIVRSIRG